MKQNFAPVHYYDSFLPAPSRYIRNAKPANENENSDCSTSKSHEHIRERYNRYIGSLVRDEHNKCKNIPNQTEKLQLDEDGMILLFQNIEFAEFEENT